MPAHAPVVSAAMVPFAAPHLHGKERSLCSLSAIALSPVVPAPASAAATPAAAAAASPAALSLSLALPFQPLHLLPLTS